ncbi:MAG: class 1 fructose-bisphosphatase [Gemmatimonadetes bacterium]|uniref:Fructose-1,6-bisphosphatase class 1 n=1 Tax=Candidatus Kutchimonas denitrificans TaxID=3056748 RepID=A0AAE4ZAY5_9BACT|nr:class 1 fructose-bisphosphatase [Gemmatimonadota bacterium]NIR75817.1 class 1 fructose-bisphosphatase [Candidatus Kutchimonas denitrificans]NIS01985.1 class 1 fructose-bisphosphatase [Gemmatimonadota bacterium]NIT67789.1 class 1 fructose-bisphosphatase [Gemmatimonadota bacterium]NIU53776.1 class 1 fructose-bisphosphatase [Gemmatimonadota bacterium]
MTRYLGDAHRGTPRLEAELAELIVEMGTAAKALAREIRRAALVGRLGLVGEKNPTGDAQKKLDVYSNDVVVSAFEDTGLVAAIVSEELEQLRVVSCASAARYILCVDPLDGSSNTDVNGSVGSIFSFYRRSAEGDCTDVETEFAGGAELAAAGYVMYGPSTIMVFSHGDGANGFTLDHDVGEFILSHEAIQCPPRGPYFSANLGNYHAWSDDLRGFVDDLIAGGPATGRPCSLRYTGALVADLHRNLLEGGIYLYPPDENHPRGKLRLLYECAPMAFIAEQAGGRATDGADRVLDLTPASIHQTTPLFIGSREMLDSFERRAARGG